MFFPQNFRYLDLLGVLCVCDGVAIPDNQTFITKQWLCTDDKVRPPGIDLYTYPHLSIKYTDDTVRPPGVALYTRPHLSIKYTDDKIRPPGIALYTSPHLS